jgi:carbonic anhydrase
MATHDDPADLTADQALQRLIDGNRRFLGGVARPPASLQQLLGDLTRGQRPYATILGCSDSRVPPEWIFDAGMGELFVVRVAGNVLSPEVAGSIQYAVSHLRTPLFVVLGHEGCGAVEAALQSRDDDVEHRSRIQLLVNSLLPALPEFDPAVSPEERLARAVESNVRWTLSKIMESPEGQARQAEGRVKLIGAIYELATGRVRLLE